MRKIRLLFFFVFVTLFTSHSFGITVYISGTISDIQGSVGVPGHKVYIKSDFSSPFHYYKTVYTDDNGYYSDTLENVPAFPVSFDISTYDCINEVHSVTVLSTNSPIIADFQICVPPYSGCRASFTYDSIAGLDYQFTDQSETNSTLISWTWDFGDPASGGNNKAYTQDPHHLYTGSGIYNVKLVIHSVSGCEDSLVKTVFIRIPYCKVIIFGQVRNDQTGEPIAAQPIMINATVIQYSRVLYSDAYGFYADTIPSVPVGIPISVATYDCNNILHSNIIYSSPTPLEVDFNVCLNTQCRAGFSAVLDSNNKVQNTFIFQDLSFGDPKQWTWNFGDGTLSHNQNPVHQFTSQGNFRVALIIKSEDSTGSMICFDTISKVITTSAYYNVGGLLFAGQFPINNPHPTGDTGVAYLYRSHNLYTVPVDTVYFTYLGYYTFLNVLEGAYIIKAGLTEGSVHYRKFIPAYTGDEIKWQQASPVVLNHSIFDNAIHLNIADDSLSGSAMIKGSVIYMGDNLKLPNAEVLLYDDNMKPVMAIRSDDGGFFEFQDLPYGTYNLYPEVTGKYAGMLQVIVDSAHQIAEGLQLQVFDHDVSGIQPIPDTHDITVGKVYPNPVAHDFQFWVQSKREMTIYTEILSITGERVSWKNISLLQGRMLVTLSLLNVPGGMYFLVVKSDDGQILSSQKIIKM